MFFTVATEGLTPGCEQHCAAVCARRVSHSCLDTSVGVVRTFFSTTYATDFRCFRGTLGTMLFFFVLSGCREKILGFDLGTPNASSQSFVFDADGANCVYLLQAYVAVQLSSSLIVAATTW